MNTLSIIIRTLNFLLGRLAAHEARQRRLVDRNATRVAQIIASANAQTAAIRAQSDEAIQSTLKAAHIAAKIREIVE